MLLNSIVVRIVFCGCFFCFDISLILKILNYYIDILIYYYMILFWECYDTNKIILCLLSFLFVRFKSCKFFFNIFYYKNSFLLIILMIRMQCWNQAILSFISA